MELEVARRIVLFLILIINMHYSHCQNNFFVIHNYDKDEYYCMTNSSFGLSWIDDKTNQEFEKVSEFVPNTHLYRHSDLKYGPDWQFETRIDDEAIFDRRWETLETYRTGNNYYNNAQLKYNVESDLKTDFNIFFSIRISNDAHLYLCDGSDVFMSNCYWFFLQGNKIQIQKKPSKDKEETKMIPLLRVEHSNNSLYLTSKQWRHFKLSKKANYLSFVPLKIDLSIIESFDREVYNVTHMMIHSLDSIGLWKIHKSEGFYSETLTATLQINNIIREEGGDICVSLFVKMCKFCNLTFTLEKEGHIEIAKKTFVASQVKWKEMKMKWKFLGDEVMNKSVALLVTTGGTNQVNEFWFIDKNIRQCHDTEYRMIKSKQKATCQLVSDDDDDIVSLDDGIISADCDDYKVMRSMFLNDTSGSLKVCGKHGSQIKCFCSIGAKSGCDCEFDDRNSKERCDHCLQHSCEDVDKCSAYSEDYDDSIRNLTITSRGVSSIGFKWQKPQNFSGEIEYYLIKSQLTHYQGCDDGDNKNHPMKFTYATKTEVTISNLSTYAKYLFSVSARNSKLAGTPVNVTLTTLPLDTITDEEIPEIQFQTIHSRSVLIKLAWTDCTLIRGPFQFRIRTSCSNEWCREDIYPEIEGDLRRLYNLTGLHPHSDYNLRIEFCRNRTICGDIVNYARFSTRPEPPLSVKDVLVYSKNESSISLRWKAPYPPTGILRRYKISCSNSSQNDIFVTDSPCKIWPDYQCFTLSKLDKMKNYTVTIQAQNTIPEGFGRATSIEVKTKTEPSKKPQNFTVHWTLKNDLELTWQHPTQANGPITLFNISLLPTIFFDEHEVIRESLPIGQYNNSYKYTIEGKRLKSSTSYTIKISAFNGDDGEEEVVDETSPPAIPFFEADSETFPSNNTIAIKILPRVNGAKEHFENQLELFLLIFDESVNNKSHPEQLQRLQEDHHVNLSKFRMVYHCQIKDLRGNYLTIGNENGAVEGCQAYENPPLNLSTTYKITVLMVNTHLGKSSYKLDSFQAMISREKNILLSTILPLFALLLIVSVGILLSYYYVTKKKTHIATQGTKGSGHERVPLVESPISKANEENASNKQDSFPWKCTPIKVLHFGKYVEDGLQGGMFKSQYEAIIQKFSNSYQNIRNSLILDYVDVRDMNNDNCHSKVYVVADVPTPDQVDDFWQIIWKENIQHIVLIDESIPQVLENYWPKESNVIRCNNIAIHCVFENTLPGYECRKFTLTHEKEIRIVDQLRLTSWPQTGKLPLVFVPFFQNMCEIPWKSESPILVHSRTDLARTGFALLCDICIRTAGQNGTVDVLGIFQNLTDSSFPLILNVDYYQLAHLVILEYLLAADIRNKLITKNEDLAFCFSEFEFRKCVKYLEETLWLDKYLPKERDVDPIYMNDIPSHSYLSTINRTCTVNCSDKFFVTQHPSPETLRHFWKIVHERNVTVIISLNEITLPNQNFWPTEDNPQIVLSDDLILKHQQVQKYNFYDCTQVQLVRNAKTKNIEIFSTTWSSEAMCPPSVTEFVEFFTQTSIRKFDSILVTCCDGGTASGLYVGMSYSVERIKQDEKFDFCKCVRMVRRQSPLFLQKEEQWFFLWRALAVYLEHWRSHET